MSEEALKLTSYFNERDRTSDGLLADELMNVFGGHRLAASVMLRGIEGFGRNHRLHTDRLLSLSEDLPAVCIAVDGRARIEAMVEVVQAVQHKGLITLERARLLTDDGLPEHNGTAAKLTVYTGRGERVAGRPAFVAVCDLLQQAGMSGATVLAGVDGTRRGRRVRARLLARNAQVPAMIVSVGSTASVLTALPRLRALVRDPLITLERVQVCRQDGGPLRAPPPPAPVAERGLTPWHKLMVHSSPAATFEGRPLHVGLMRHLRDAQVTGATSVRGVWGFHGRRRAEGDRLLQVRRHVPVLTVILETPARIGGALEVIDVVTREHGLVTSEIVPALSTAGAPLAPPQR